MKRKGFSIALLFLILLMALVFSAAQEAVNGGASLTPTPWQPEPPATAPIEALPTPGWWDELPTPIPFPSATAER
jgi:hypothetical protein